MIITGMDHFQSVAKRSSLNGTMSINRRLRLI